MLLQSSRVLCAASLVLTVFTTQVWAGGYILRLFGSDYGRVNADTICQDSPCSVNAECIEETCTCKEGMYGDGFSCYSTQCYSYPCQNGGVCSMDNGNYSCECPIGFKGKDCQNQVYPCGKPVPAGTCKQGTNAEYCADGEDDSCGGDEAATNFFSSGSTGNSVICCENGICQNDGKCLQIKDPQGQVTCQCSCLHNFKGDNCSESDMNCANNPCKNGGTCNNDTGNVPKCDCLKGYVGVLCQEREYQSYLNFPRIHFAGIYQADVPTVNNVLQNFDTQNFVPSDAESFGRGGWNPGGSGAFRIVDTTVNKICHVDGYCHFQVHDDPMIGASLKDQGRKATAKLADVDITVQGHVTEVWGLTLEVDGFLKGNVDRTSFQYLWNKMAGVSGDYGDATKFQSVLTNVQFGPKVKYSRVAQYFQDEIGVNQELSISFNIDMTGEDFSKDNYTYGRIVGSIGMSGRNSPRYFTHGRMLKPLPGVKDASFAPFVIDNVGKTGENILMDLANSLAIDQSGEFLPTIGELRIGINKDEDVNNPTCLNNIQWINNIYQDTGGYIYGSGIQEIPVPEEVQNKLKNHQVVLAKIQNEKCFEVILAEDKNGVNIHPLSRWVFTAEPGKSVKVKLFATVFGETPMDTISQPIVDVKIKPSISIINPSERNPEQDVAVHYAGKGIYDIDMNNLRNPNNIRNIIDGQMYAYEYIYNDNPLETNRLTAINSAVYLRVWNTFLIPDKPTWIRLVQPIFHQYANLYPVMKINFMDLGNYHDVRKHSSHIKKTMMLDENDPNFMPVTRDLSPQKTKMILKWLSEEEPIYEQIHFGVTVETLRHLLQIALQLEHATIPPYFNGFFSIKQGQNQEVEKILHDIVIQEMYHFAQVSNLLNAVGGNPDLLRDHFIPSYPSYMPGGIQPELKVTIDKISYRQIQDVYIEIEKPFHELKEHGILDIINKILGVGQSETLENSRIESLDTMFDDIFENDMKTNYNTIGGLYKIIVLVLGKLTKWGNSSDIFENNSHKQLVFGQLVHVTNLSTAFEAIKVIVEQGEGASPCNPMQSKKKGAQPSHYFQFSSIVHKRNVMAFTNDQYQGILNTKKDDPTVAHTIANYKEQNTYCNGSYDYTGSEISFYDGGVWPIVKDPRMSKYIVNSKAYKVAKAFNEMYSELLHSLQSVFNGNVELFGDAMGLMKSLIVYGRRVVQTPIDDDGDPEIGPNAGPTYVWD